uniref:Thioredoxin domain-containing protein n=1 Tax=viral metagenome TaxID=1070528 RepID=A0A6C0I588_9ZZZZ
MSITDVTELTVFNELLTTHEYVIVKFSAEWCSPCKRIHPLYEQYSQDNKYSSICFVHVDVDHSRDICDKCKITAMPTFILFKNNNEEKRFTGPKSETLLEVLNSCVNSQ